jgi:hypothetical protein
MYSIETTKWEKSDNFSPTGSFSPVSFVLHPNFDVNTFAYDYAIITLPKDAMFTTSVSPICLPAGSAGQEKK